MPRSRWSARYLDNMGCSGDVGTPNKAPKRESAENKPNKPSERSKTTAEMTRAELLRRAITIIKLRHLERYGFEDVDETWLKALSDDALRQIIESDKPSPSCIW